MAKKRVAPKSGKSTPPRPRTLLPAVPPPDDPLRRYDADIVTHIGPDDERDAALARATALRQAREMPTEDPAAPAGPPDSEND